VAVTGFIGSAAPRPKLLASVTSTTSTITVPATVKKGDYLVLSDFATTSSGSPTSVIPSGFSEVKTTGPAGNRKVITSRKIAVGTEASTILTGMNGNRTNSKILLVFRGGKPPVSDNLSTPLDQETQGNPTPQTVAASGGTPPLLIFGVYTAMPNALGIIPSIDPRTLTIGGNDAKDGEVGVEIVNSAHWVAFRAFYFGQTPADAIVDMEDEGSLNMMQSFYSELS
jgi:hypothetical protein